MWTLHINGSGAAAAPFDSVLTRDEKDRAERFRFDHLRNAFVTTRGTLRHLLGRYLTSDPASIRFKYSATGKPTVASTTGIEFNVTHSGSLAVFSVASGCQLGVDVERIRPLTEMQDIARRFFCRDEVTEIMSLPSHERVQAFFCCWTRKEAYVKATGDGMSAALDGFRVTLRPNESARFVHVANDRNGAKAWTLHDLSLSRGYAAALAYRDHRRRLSVFPIGDPAELFTSVAI